MLQDFITEKLLENIPDIRNLISATVSDADECNSIEKTLASLHFTVGDGMEDEHYSVPAIVQLLPLFSDTYGGHFLDVLESMTGIFDQIIEAVVTGYLAGEGQHKTLLQELLKDLDSTQAFIDCSKGYLFACALKLRTSMSNSNWVSQDLIGAYCRRLDTLDLLQRLQLARIEYAVKDFPEVIGFFCPDNAFRKNFGQLPSLLEARGYAVLYLYGLSVGDDFESHSTSFYVGGELVLKLGCVDLFFTATIMDALPDHSKKAMIIHGSFAPFAPEGHQGIVEAAGEGQMSAEEQYQRAVAARTHFSAFFRLFDYYVVSSEYYRNAIKSIAVQYGISSSPELAPRPVHRHFEVFSDALKDREIPKNIYIVPAGYPQIDANIRAVTERHVAPKKIITYAPTPLNGKPVWNQYSSLYNAGMDIVATLLSAFPDYEVVFKPHVEDKNAQTLNIVERFTGQPGFRVDWGGSDYMKLYAETSILVSDFSSTAYTFALSTLRPVLFYSPAEDQMPTALRSEAYCRNRSAVGRVARTPTELVESISYLLNHLEEYHQKIAIFRDANIFHVGNSEEYLSDVIGDMISGEPLPEWDRLCNSVMMGSK
ncbi:MAG: CDP-glycerol glycerophosphotransferase family protein [Hydrogenophilales bacterium]|nr:CDP-glycerol glycerophosphotransferase family protein [Hydrogenophilales bacterium]